MKLFLAKAALAAGWAVISLAACGGGETDASYAVGPGILIGRVQAEFTAKRDGDGDRVYRARAEARVRIRRTAAPDGGVAVELHVDSVAYSGSERDAAELAFMRGRLERYRAAWRMTPEGHAFDLTEEPELPRGDFTCRLGPMLAAALPVLAGPGNREAVVDTQSLFDASEPKAAMVQLRKGADRKTGGELRGSRDCFLRLGEAEAGAELMGKSGFHFDPQLGFPRTVDLDLQGDFSPTPRETEAAVPAMRMRYQYRFEMIEVVAATPSADPERAGL
jgi:hypothetical protein